MQDVHKIFPRKYFVQTSCMAMVVLAFFGAQTMPVRPTEKAYKGSIFSVASVEIAVPVEVTTTTSTTVVEVTTTEPEPTTIQEPITTTTTTRPKVTTTTNTTMVVVSVSSSDGPPHNITTLVGCISYYESRWGADPNVFQFTQGTWETYGGKGSPSLAPYSTQEAIFWLAWEDDGHHHWAAQKGRCF